MKKQSETQSEEQQSSNESEPVYVQNSYLVYRVGIDSNTVSDVKKIEHVTKLVTSACELAAADYNEVTLDVSMMSDSPDVLPISLVRGKTDGC